MYTNPYGSEDQDLDPTTQRRRAILDLMDPNEPSRSIQAHQSPTNIAHDDVYRPMRAEAPDESTSTNPYTGTQQPQASTSLQAGYRLLDALDDPYTRRGGYGGMEPTRKAISMGLISSGNPYAMAAGGIGMLDSWLRRKAETAPTDFSTANATQIMRDAAPLILGREMPEEAIQQAWRDLGQQSGDRWVGEKGVQYLLQQWYDSPEAQAFRASQQAASATGGGTGTTGNAASAGTPGAAGTGGVGSTSTTAATATSAGGGMPGTLEGFTASKFNDPNKHDTKYDFAHLIADLPPTPASLDARWDAIKQAFPNAKRTGDDSIDFGDGYGSIDVIRAAGEGGKAWHFEPESGAESGAASAAPVASAQSLPSTPGAAQLAAPLTNNDVLQQIMEEVRRIQSGQAPRNAILAQMGLA